MYGGSGVDHRLPIAWFLLLIASSAPRFPTRRFATAIGIVAGSMLMIRRLHDPGCASTDE
jgi:hypothetical protein